MLKTAIPDLNDPRIQEIIQTYKLADQVIAIEPTLDREFVVQLILFLKYSPQERLRRALLRGKLFRRVARFKN